MNLFTALFACFGYKNKSYTIIFKRKFKMGITTLNQEEIDEIKRLLLSSYAYILDNMSLKTQFESAVKIIQSLPKHGPYEPTISFKLRLYSLFKQATIGNCNVSRPPFYQVEELLKWKNWKSLKDMPSEEAMQLYITELKTYFDKLQITKEAEDFFFESGLFLEYERMPGAEITETYKEKYMERSAPYRGMTESILGKSPFEEVNNPSPQNSSGEDSSGGTDSFVIYDEKNKFDENIESELLDSKTNKSVFEEESEEEYSDPSETLEEQALEAKSFSPTSSAFFSLEDNQELQLLGKEYAIRRMQKGSSKVRAGKEMNELERSDLFKTQGLSPDASAQLLQVLQKIHVDLKEMIVKLDKMEDKSFGRHYSRYCYQSERSRSGSSDVAEKRWWPFPELSPRSTFILLLWPLILHGAIRLLFILRLAHAYLCE